MHLRVNAIAAGWILRLVTLICLVAAPSAALSDRPPPIATAATAAAAAPPAATRHVTPTPAQAATRTPIGRTVRAPTATALTAASALPYEAFVTPARAASRLAYVFPIRPQGLASYRQGHHDYPAADIFAPAGSAFVAVTSGVVDFVSIEDRWNPSVDDPATRGGLSVAIVGDDGVRYYGSHLSAIAPGIAPGSRVSAGQLLGYTGQSGNARGTAPHLHFGISRPTAPDDWRRRRGEVDPYPYLQAWAAGEMTTPRIDP